MLSAAIASVIFALCGNLLVSLVQPARFSADMAEDDWGNVRLDLLAVAAMPDDSLAQRLTAAGVSVATLQAKGLELWRMQMVQCAAPDSQHMDAALRKQLHGHDMGVCVGVFRTALQGHSLESFHCATAGLLIGMRGEAAEAADRVSGSTRPIKVLASNKRTRSPEEVTAASSGSAEDPNSERGADLAEQYSRQVSLERIALQLELRGTDVLDLGSFLSFWLKLLAQIL